MKDLSLEVVSLNDVVGKKNLRIDADYKMVQDKTSEIEIITKLLHNKSAENLALVKSNREKEIENELLKAKIAELEQKKV